MNNAGITGGFSRVESAIAGMLERLWAVNATGIIPCAREAVIWLLSPAASYVTGSILTVGGGR